MAKPTNEVLKHLSNQEPVHDMTATNPKGLKLMNRMVWQLVAIYAAAIAIWFHLRLVVVVGIALLGIGWWFAKQWRFHSERVNADIEACQLLNVAHAPNPGQADR